MMWYHNVLCTQLACTHPCPGDSAKLCYILRNSKAKNQDLWKFCRPNEVFLSSTPLEIPLLFWWIISTPGSCRLFLQYHPGWKFHVCHPHVFFWNTQLSWYLKLVTAQLFCRQLGTYLFLPRTTSPLGNQVVLLRDTLI